MELFWMSNIGSNFGDEIMELMYNSKDERIHEILSGESIHLLSRCDSKSSNTTKEYKRMSQGCLNMISNYVNTVLGNTKEDSVKMFQESIDLTKPQKTQKNDLMLTKSFLLQSQEISEKAKEVVKQEGEFIQDQINSYFMAYEESWNTKENNLKGEKSAVNLVTSQEAPLSWSLSSTSEKYRNLSFSDQNFISQKVQEYYNWYKSDTTSNSSTSEKLHDLDTSDWSLIRGVVKDYLSLSISQYSYKKLKGTDSPCEIWKLDNKIDNPEADSDDEHNFTTEIREQVKGYLDKILQNAENNILRQANEEEKSELEREAEQESESDHEPTPKGGITGRVYMNDENTLKLSTGFLSRE